MLSIILAIPFFAAVASFFTREKRNIELLNVCSQAVVMVLSVVLAVWVARDGALFSPGGFLMADALSAYMAAIIGTISFVVIVYSVFYLSEEMRNEIIGMRRFRQYFALLQLFIFTMLLAVLSDNLAVMWIAIEGTTLATAFLISFYNNEKTLEAAWKYIIICTVGITLALFGTILTYYASLKSGMPAVDVLLWSSIAAQAHAFGPELMKIAFIFIFVGYGTKVGLVPMHTWLPDAHTRAPSPISALMSGVLLNVALYSILRFKVITDAALGAADFTNRLFLIFGVTSVVAAAFIILVARKYKRMLAYSSIENMGLISLGIGFGHPLAVMGALWHIVNHALAKSLLFFTAGNVFLKYHSGKIGNVRGMLTVIPWTSFFFICGILAIVGVPPFSIFFSKLLIFSGGFASSYGILAFLMLLPLAVVFAGFFRHAGAMLFGEPPQELEKGEARPLTIIPILFTIALLLVFSIAPPADFMRLLEQMRAIIQ
ncbi:hypothetical protein A3C91_02455 [Candidatus Azambacteria bacterium RIFCSPHIGHO2_02_FULL_52_12]|uniref:NADH:quinone oxidoreductase/Mrp antiporter membrane subunit domain-containing protein n=1 Tax=Candidatus Azambacteria bacterium RIFCSPLOWO2_01_FULL_46_25 TaxID=1797298 RepID=A0A1F5BVN9_9BACT|nr:MAG: hypothetical protein A3C91_02455 [Candidatus Azambacteria bacterium RIFCSPHIGHO2_02_FULL_52_12]OGD34683.1 MAG: hypothetical protein A2988_04250 [Candidatus Azambacteria bacterium RIFCSPLOWO2_01_FULL_46_25]OGD37453.1 MAG: hypothetical protein A2850_02680 [Candidatus Azambacteria bacterium RIFCSPHIGHO2_01_FULL_51_74]